MDIFVIYLRILISYLLFLCVLFYIKLVGFINCSTVLILSSYVRVIIPEIVRLEVFFFQI